MKRPALDPSMYQHRADRSVCPSCEATPDGCEARHWLSGRRCCATCTGDHNLHHHNRKEDNR